MAFFRRSSRTALQLHFYSLYYIRGLCSSRSYTVKSDLKLILTKMKLKRFHIFEREPNLCKYLEPLKNNHEELDLIHVRQRQPNLLYLRTELLLQRLHFLRPIGITKREKRKLIERSPPVLLLVNKFKNAESVSYLRGIIGAKTDSERVHVLHPCSVMVVASSSRLRQRVNLIEEELGMAQQSVLKFLLKMPCFLLKEINHIPEKFRFIHRFHLPEGFNPDKHTAEVYPPVFGATKRVNPRLFVKEADDDLAKMYADLKLSDILDYSYPEHHGKGMPEDLTKFLISAEQDELRPRYNKAM